jgi:hypothetical protein
MTPETSGHELLAAIEQTLSREIAPSLSGEARFKTLMAASALRMVMRELTGVDESAAASAKLAAFGRPPMLAAAIRSGQHDAAPELHAALAADALARVRISNPAKAALPDTSGHNTSV